MQGSDDHIKLLRLFDLSKDAEATEQEKEHLRKCDECRSILAAFARQFGKQKRPNDKPEDAA
jgi:predicted anti-sigma-YlaC factor YlaD